MEPKKVFLLPSEMCFSKEPAEIGTLLGSCVAVCFFNSKLKIGGMNHFMLDKTPPGQAPSGKYGDYATETLIQLMFANDRNTANIEASVFGGGNVVGHLNIENGIGARNIIMARDILKEHNINIVSSRYIGGECGRKIYFKTWTGEIEVKKIEKSEQTLAIESKEKDLRKRKIRVLVVDDSKTVRSIISSAISQDPGIEVVGEAENPYEARELLLEFDPDVICLDVIMPKMDGITFLKKIFLYQPKPVIIISTVVQKGNKIYEQAKKIGAVDIINKEELDLYARPDLVSSVLISKVKLAAATYVRKKAPEEMENI